MMKDSDFEKLQEWVNVGGGLMPFNDNATEMLEQSHQGEIFTFKEVGNRDLSFHRCYFSLLRYIYNYLPPNFKSKVDIKHFYQFLKHMRKEYDVLYTFKDGTTIVEYKSISFGNMSQKEFENYVREQLPWIYENVIAAFFKGAIYDGIVDTIEKEYIKFLAQL